MSSLATLARPYAKAAFELARDGQELSGWDEMLGLASAIVSEASMAELMDNPLVGRDRIVGIFTDAAGERFDQRFRDFLKVLAVNDRLPLLPQVHDLFRELRNEAENRLQVRVVSAVPLDDEQAGRMKAALAERFKCEIELENEVNDGVIGGAVVYAGDQVIDGSLRGRLQKLSNSLAQ
jgi:F-type H+-transporting ATPase subunit delta